MEKKKKKNLKEKKFKRKKILKSNPNLNKLIQQRYFK